MKTRARDLYEQIEAGRPPLLLDVRNEDEFVRSRIEGRREVEAINVPYFQFIEDEEAAAARVDRWLGGRPRRLVVVCAKGGSSEYVAEVLRGRGFEALNLEGGMVAWGQETVVREIPASPVRVSQVIRFGKGCLSYLLASGRDAVVVDPHRHVEEYLRLLHDRGLVLRGVFDTHLHADHLSGAPALAAEAGGVPYYAHRADFETTAHPIAPIADGERLRLGQVEVAPLVFLHGPGHTPGSVALLVNDQAILSGDTLFVESVGRPDLAGKAAEWGADLHRTLHRRFERLGDGLLVLPAHTASPREARPDGSVAAPLGALRQNQSLRLGEAEFVTWVSGAISQAPAHYDRIRRVNLGNEAAGEEDQVTLELGRNECAVARTIGR